MPRALDTRQLSALLPHAGRMCLLSAVEHWDDAHLRASADSHRTDAHPLARDGIVNAVHALEYGAQAMAIHAALLARDAGEPPRGGHLASARQLRLHRARLDDLRAALRIEVERHFAQAGSLVYGFRVTAGDEPVAEGVASVFTQ